MLCHPEGHLATTIWRMMMADPTPDPATILDSACGYAAFSMMPADVDVLTVEYKVNLLRPARSARYRVVGHVMKAGRTLRRWLPSGEIG